MTMLGIGIMLVIIIYQLRNLVKVWNPRTVA
jgi:hypothetical protein